MNRDYSTDSQLIDRMQTNDTAAFEEIYHRYWFSLYSYCLGKLHTREEAKQIVKKIFVDLWENRFTIPVDFSVNHHLYSCVRNAVVEALHHQLDEGTAVAEEILPTFATQALQQARKPVAAPVKTPEREDTVVRPILFSMKPEESSFGFRHLRKALQMMMNL